MRTRARTDTTHAPIVEALRAVGASVQSLASIGHGCPDLLVAYRSATFVIEVKSPGGLLTPDECRWIAGWRGPVWVVDSVDGALEAIGATARASGRTPQTTLERMNDISGRGGERC